MRPDFLMQNDAARVPRTFNQCYGYFHREAEERYSMLDYSIPVRLDEPYTSTGNKQQHASFIAWGRTSESPPSISCTLVDHRTSCRTSSR